MVERVRVGDVLRLQRRSVVIDPVAEYRLIGVYSFGKGILHRESISGAELGEYRFFSIEPGDLVLSNIQAWEGAIALAEQRDRGTVGSHRFLSYVPVDEQIDTDWARWFFLSERGMDLIRQAAPGSTMRNRTLAIERFEALEIPLPPIDGQRRVANRLHRLLDRVAREAIPAASTSETAHPRLGESRLAEAVDHLRRSSECQSTLGEVGEWSSGGTPRSKEPGYYDGAISWAVIGDLNDGIVYTTGRSITDLGLANSSAKVVPPGTVLVAMYGSIGKLGVSGSAMATNQAIASCRVASDLVTAEYLVSFLRCIRGELVQLGQGGAQQNISQGLLKAVTIPTPGHGTQEAFVARVSHQLAQTERARDLCDRRKALLLSLVPSALNEAFAGLS